jgi:glycosyltransferase involved in cell wall biosynthesis
MSAWLLIAGDFTTWGGMDAANFGLASYLAPHSPLDGGAGTVSRAAAEVHLVSHRVSPDLVARPSVRTHIVPRPLGAERFGEPLLRLAARKWQRRLADRDVRIVANGGNADAGDVNWVHYVHAAFDPDAAGILNRFRVRSNHRRYLDEERRALRRARVVICNSRRTADDVVRLVGVDRSRTRIVYYGVDPDRFSLVTDAERQAARRALGLAGDRRLALFAGALADRRKGFDTLYDAWRQLCARSDWDVDLIVVGTGAELPKWQARTTQELPEGRVRFLGFRRDMPAVFAACDLLVHPARYEAYGLAVHEAICRGIPAIVSASAGIAERYPEDLNDLLLTDPQDSAELIQRLTAWRGSDSIAGRLAVFASRLRSRTWDHMGRDIIGAVDAAA